MKISKNDDHGVGTEEGRSNTGWGGVLRRTLRRWGVFWLSDKVDAIFRYPLRRDYDHKDNLLRPHLFGVIRGREDGLDR